MHASHSNTPKSYPRNEQQDQNEHWATLKSDSFSKFTVATALNQRLDLPPALDSGLHSRLYDFVMATNNQAVTLMRIGKVAKRTSLTVDAIRFYEKRKLLPRAVRTAGRFRLYGESSVERLHFIQQMQGLGFSLREVGELIQLRERKVDACESVRELLKAKLADVRGKERELRHLESELETDLRKCHRELNHRRRHAACPCPVLEEAAGVNQ